MATPAEREMYRTAIIEGTSSNQAELLTGYIFRNTVKSKM
jgi:hypothetical protein